MMLPGDPAPYFRAQAMDGKPDYVFDTAAGRHIVLLMFGSAGDPAGRAAIDLVLARRALFDDARACLFGVTVDPADAEQRRIAPMMPEVRYFLDYDRAVSRLYGAERDDVYHPVWILLDPGLRVVATFPIDRGAAALDLLETLVAAPQTGFAPVLVLPQVFERGLCRRLVELYDAEGGTESGFMREVDGKTVMMLDAAHKRRADCTIRDRELCRGLAARINRRIVPAIARAFQFKVTRMERYIVARYDAAAGGHFRAHRDNTTKGTAHRRFAVTINLNAEDYQGGDLRFPEYGPRSRRAPTGGAVVFSCGVLHEALPVTEGMRYCFLPFLYDDAAAAQREENNAFLGEGVGAYRA